MSYLDLFITALGLSMDAFAVAICKGLATGEAKLKHALITGGWFGGFQALMPLLGYLVGSLFAAYVRAFDHWIAFALLGLIGANMLREAFSGEGDGCSDSNGCSVKNPFGFVTMLTMAVATSIDALAVGVNYAFMLEGYQIIFAVLSIGIITFILSAVGVKLGAVFGAKFKKPAEISGGVILVGMGIKILVEHLFFGG